MTFLLDDLWWFVNFPTVLMCWSVKISDARVFCSPVWLPGPAGLTSGPMLTMELGCSPCRSGVRCIVERFSQNACLPVLLTHFAQMRLLVQFSKGSSWSLLEGRVKIRRKNRIVVNSRYKSVNSLRFLNILIDMRICNRIVVLMFLTKYHCQNYLVKFRHGQLSFCWGH